jgi:hypothetical protein
MQRCGGLSSLQVYKSFKSVQQQEVKCQLCMHVCFAWAVLAMPQHATRHRLCSDNKLDNGVHTFTAGGGCSVIALSKHCVL